MNKTINISIILALFITIFVSCKKTPPIEVPVTNNQVVFNVTGNFNRTPINYSAGENGYYMYSDYSNIPFFYFNSELKQNNCSYCPNSIGITLSSNNYDTVVNNFDIDTNINISSQFSYSYTYLDSGNNYVFTFNPANIRVYYINNNGVKYESKNVTQQAGYFNILNIEDFNNNELGQKTKKVDFELSCLVNDSISLQSGDTLMLNGTFAFSYPSP
jgi:hypothetical protein